MSFKKDDTITCFYYNKFSHLRLDYFNLHVNKIEEVDKFKFENKSFKSDEKSIKSENEMF